MLSKLNAVLGELVVSLRLLNALLKWLVWGLTVRPSGFGERSQISEEGVGMAQVFTYRQGLLPVPAGVAEQRLTVTVDGVEQIPIVVSSEATSVEFKAGPAGASVRLKLDYLDAAGNDSSDVETDFVIVDGIPPVAPTGFGAIEQVAEEDV